MASDRSGGGIGSGCSAMGSTRVRRALLGALVCVPVASGSALADEGGVSFWLPGQYASFAAVPGQPGWSGAVVYYHTSVEGDGDREFTRGGGINLGIEADADLGFLAPSYTFEEPLWGGQATLGVTTVFGHNKTSTDATLAGPGGNVLSGGRTDSVTGLGDLYPTFSLKWNDGVNNYMAYAMGGIPVGDYKADRLANLGIGHGAIDGGAGYTYLDTKTGFEFSIVGGLTYNFENPDTDYQNGIDGHIDMATSQFLSESFHLGVVGYAYQQLTGDSGSGAVLGSFKSRVFGAGPQLGYFFPAGGAEGYLNLRGYYEFGADHRPEGWNTYLTLSFSPAPPK